MVNKMLQRQTGSNGVHLPHIRRWACGRDFRVDSLSISQQDLLVHDGPPPTDFVGHDEFSEDEAIPVVDMALFKSTDADAVKKNVEHMVAACQVLVYPTSHIVYNPVT